MQLFKSRSHYLIVDREHCLWCNRFDGSLEAKPSPSVEDLKTREFSCHIEGVVGKIQIFPDGEAKLILILAKSTVAQISGNHEIFRIDKVGLLPLSPTEPTEGNRLLFYGRLENELPEAANKSNESLSESNLIMMNRGVQKTLKTLRQATNFNIGLKQNRRDRSDRDKLERRILEDIIKMFNDSQSFYYSHTWDLTNSMQRLFKQQQHNNKSHPSSSASWCAADERFFWNRDLWKDLLTGSNKQEDDYWIIPVVQGYVQLEKMVIDLNSFDSAGQLHAHMGEYVAPMCCSVILISRRSRYRAGTRYKRRGIDEKGNCANFVETEQILEIMGHCLSFLQVRGSIPVYWSQPGMRYRPAPRLDRSEQDSHAALGEHFKEQLKLYKHEILINLVEQTGREKILADAYLQGILNHDSENLVYVSYDFHEYCRGLRLENIGILIQSLQDVFQNMRFFWCKSLDVLHATEEQIMCTQRSVFRVNCVDCLDRTNVIQASLARFVVESQLRKMGLLLPDVEFPVECKQVLQTLWANNGDIISRQYAGTSALKGDITRTGERKFTGLMKDGYTSANRYYLNQFKDAYRQAAVDASLGKHFQEESILVPGVSTALDPTELDRVKQLVDDCKRILIPDTEIALGGWPMVDADLSTADPARQDMDTVLLLSTHAYYVGEYSDESDQLVGYQRVPLHEVESIEIGPEVTMFRTGRTVLRINYHIGDTSGYCHQLKTAGLRMFNNMVMPLITQDECVEMLRSIGESFRMALESQHEISIPVMFGPLQRKISKIPPKETAESGAESEGGIFTAARAVPSHPNTAVKPHLGEMLSAVKSKLAGFNPINRLHLPHRNLGNTSVAYSKDAKKLGAIPSINIHSPIPSPALSERASSEDSSDDSSPLPDSKILDRILDGSGVAVTGPSPLDDGNDVFPARHRSEDSPESPDTSRRLSLKTRHQSRSSDTLDHHPPLIDFQQQPSPHSPLVLSASPSMKAFHDNNPSEKDFVVITDADIPVNFRVDSDSNINNCEKPLVMTSPTKSSTASFTGVIKSKYDHSKSKRACRTRIIEL